MPKKSQNQQPHSLRSPRIPVIIALAVILVLALSYFLWQRDSLSMQGFSETPATPTVNPVYTGVEGCRRLPKFFEDIGIARDPLVGTSFRNYVGFVIYDRNGTKNFIQHYTWREAGNLGGFINDGQGNFYVIPVPFVSVALNPPEKQTILYRIDAISGIMSPVLNLPAASPPTNANPFGLMGLGIDCETNSLYVTSVAGSSAAKELGRIFRVDLKTLKVADQYENVDAIGVGVFKGVSGKRLYYGAARTPQVFSISLDEKGNFVGEPRVEFSVATIPEVGDQRVRRINFLAPQEMAVRSVEFNFTLKASSEVPSDLISFVYDPLNDGWILNTVSPYKPEP